MTFIRFYFKPENPVDYGKLEIKVEGNDFSEILTENDRTVIEDNWDRLRKERGDKVFSRPGGLGTLYEVKDGVFTFRPTEFKVYIAVTNSYEGRLLSPSVYDNMRISAVGATLRLLDGSVFVHRRSPNVTHAKNMIDSSVAGLAPVDQLGITIDFKKALLEKLKRELKITEAEVKRLDFRGVHSSYDPDFSAMFDFSMDVALERGHIEERVDRSYFGEHFFVPSDKLPDFVVEHFANKRDMIGDGCANILASLDDAVFRETVGLIRKGMDNGVIQFGRLENGLFVPESPGLSL